MRKGWKIVLIIVAVCIAFGIVSAGVGTLTDQKALNASPLRDIIIRSWNEEQAYLRSRRKKYHFSV